MIKNKKIVLTCGEHSLLCDQVQENQAQRGGDQKLDLKRGC